MRRDLNLPTVSLWLLRRENHPRFTFKRQKDEAVDGRNCRALAFKEKVMPMLISTRNSGDVEGIDILVPVQMWEWYEGVSVTTQRGRGNEFMGAQGLATYSKFRTFQVSTSETVK